jgi:hypothetical protein
LAVDLVVVRLRLRITGLRFTGQPPVLTAGPGCCGIVNDDVQLLLSSRSCLLLLPVNGLVDCPLVSHAILFLCFCAAK